MIQEFIDRFKEIKGTLIKEFSIKEPESYEDIFRITLKHMFKDAKYREPDYENITVIDNGDYQGTLVFIIPARTYQPSTYWVACVNYGSCSGCDTFMEYSNSANPKESAKDMATMALHMIESMKQIL